MMESAKQILGNIPLPESNSIHGPFAAKQQPKQGYLAAKMLNIMAKVGYLQKKGKNSAQNYNYLKEADVVQAIRGAMIEERVFMYTSVRRDNHTVYQTKSGSTQFLVSVTMDVKFVDVDSGESQVCTFCGDGADTGDKGIYKAITGAEKYALMKTFLIETGDDPEKESPEEPKNTIGDGLSDVDDSVEERIAAEFQEREERVMEITKHIEVEFLANGVAAAYAHYLKSTLALRDKDKTAIRHLLAETTRVEMKRHADFMKGKP